jgi:hypothetical protein
VSLPFDVVSTPRRNTEGTSAQYKWLEADLAKVDRTVTPWLVASMHAPWYNSNFKHHDEAQEVGMKAALEAMLVAAKTDIIFSGHVHAYERTNPVANNVTTPGAPIHINIGDAGNREGPCPDYYPQPEWHVARLRTEFYTYAIGSHACSLQASKRVTNSIPLGCPLPLTVRTFCDVTPPKVCLPRVAVRAWRHGSL